MRYHCYYCALVLTAWYSLQVKGPERDIHSGNDGGVFNEPLSDLTKLLASLVDSRNNIMVPGFYSGVRPNTLGAALQRLDNCNEFSLEGYREALGIPKLASAANMRLAIHSLFILQCVIRSQVLQCACACQVARKDNAFPAHCWLRPGLVNTVIMTSWTLAMFFHLLAFQIDSR